MKRIAHHYLDQTARAVAATALAAAFAFTLPVYAASTEVPEATVAKASKASRADRVEARINDIHTKLNITPSQEDQWNKVAEVMRDNGEKMEALTQERLANAGSMNAVDDLKSYGEIAEEHEDGIKKLVPVFADLYDSMSNAQKKVADTLFRGHEPGHHRHRTTVK